MTLNKAAGRWAGRIVAAGLAATILAGAPPQARAARQVHDSERLRLDYGEFVVNGSYTRRACSAQANVKSRNGKNVGFALYWRVGKDLYLLVSHPDNAALKGRQKITFAFDDGRKVVFPMRGRGKQLQVPIGFGPRGTSFYNAIQKNNALRILMPGVNDEVRISLARKAEVERAMWVCEQWMK